MRFLLINAITRPKSVLAHRAAIEEQCAEYIAFAVQLACDGVAVLALDRIDIAATPEGDIGIGYVEKRKLWQLRHAQTPV